MLFGKKELLNKITAQFLAQINPESGYYQGGRTSGVLQKVLESGDLSVMNRIFDDINTDHETAKAWYKALVHSNDPVHELLVPLIHQITQQIFDANNKGFNENMRSFFAKNEQFKPFLQNPVALQNAMVIAVGSSLLAIATTGMMHRIEDDPKLSADSEAVRTKSQTFTRKVSIPCDEYLNKLTIKKLFADVNRPSRFYLFLVSALKRIMSLFSGSQSPHSADNAQSDISTEKKIDILFKVMTQALDQFSPNFNPNETYTDSEAPQDPRTVFARQMNIFRERLSAIKEEMQLRKEENMEYKDFGKESFESTCKSFSARIEEYLQLNQEPLNDADQKTIASIVNELTTQAGYIAPTLEDDSEHTLSSSFKGGMR